MHVRLNTGHQNDMNIPDATFSLRSKHTICKTTAASPIHVTSKIAGRNCNVRNLVKVFMIIAKYLMLNGRFSQSCDMLFCKNIELVYSLINAGNSYLLYCKLLEFLKILGSA